MNDTDRELEELLSGAVFEPDQTFRERLHGQLLNQLEATNSAGLIPAPSWRDPTVSKPSFPIRKGLWASLTLVGLVFLLLVAVPSVRASTLRLILSYYQVIFAHSDPGAVPNTFQPLTPAYLPAQLIGSAFRVQEAPEPPSFEMRYFSQQEFVVIHQTPDRPNQSLPSREKIQFDGRVGILEDGLSGIVQLVSPLPQSNDPDGSGSGGGGGGWDMEGPPPSEMQYSGAIRITWVQSGVRIEILSNLPIDEILKIAASMDAAIEATPEMQGLEESE